MARKPRTDQTDSFGSDSFLDIVSNIVGILIILVMVVGVRVKSASEIDIVPPEPETPAPAPQLDVASAQADVDELQDEIQQVSAALSNTEIEADQKARRLNLLASSIEDSKDEIDAARNSAAARSQAAAEIAEDVEAKRRQYEALLFEIKQQAEIKPKAVRIDSFQTPVSRTVMGKELHFQLKGGYVARVPIEELAEKVKDDFRGKLQFMRSSPKLTNVVGPIEGFECEYTAARLDGGGADPMFDQLVAQLKHATFIPQSDQLGETLDESLSASSRFRSIVGRSDPSRTVITLWTYPDSFAAFRQLRRELYQLGFSVAARPLPFGHPIGVSSSGSRSMAQ